jgi:carbon-monoxide dehydrogenase medium subunit
VVRLDVLEPKTLAEAFSLLADYKDDAKIIAGGQNLLVLIKQRRVKPRYLINIKNLNELEYIKDCDDVLRIGALTTHRTIELSSLIRAKYNILSEMELELGDVQTRNWGTIGGSLCQASPSGDPAPVLISLGAKVRVASIHGERYIALEKFFTGYLTTALEPHEILLEIQLPNPLPLTGAAFHKEVVRKGDLAIASTAVSVTLDKTARMVSDARILLQAVGPTPIRAREAEKVIIGEDIRQKKVLEEAASMAVKEASPVSDVYGSEDYKRAMVRVATKCALNDAISRAQLKQLEDGR